MRLLVVDDDAQLRHALGRLLTGAGHSVLTVHDGGTALALISDRLQGVLSDVDMPGMSGIELARRLREQRPDLPVVLMTGGDVARAARESGCPAYDKIDLVGGLDGVIAEHFGGRV